MEARTALIKKLKKIGKFILIAAIAFLICAPIVAFFRINSNAHVALREGKNVKLTLHMVDIEYYGAGKSIFDSTKQDGLREGVARKIEDILGHKGTVVIQRYDVKSRVVLAFVYTTDHYQVTYRYDEKKGDTWRVDYIINVLK